MSMKKILFLAAVLVSSLVANAKVWRINPNEAARADFLNVKAACDALKVNRGDTLYCEAGLYTVEDNNYITKNDLTIIGPGFGFKNAYGSTSAISEANFPVRLTIDADSIHIIGIKAAEIQYRSWNGANYYGVHKNLTIERCYIGRFWSGERYEKLSNVTLRNNYFNLAIYHNDSYAPIDFTSCNVLDNVNIENNIILGNGYGIWLNAGVNTSAMIAHNTIICTIQYTNQSLTAIRAQHTIIRDNIIINTNSDSYLFKFNNECFGENQVYNNVLSLNAENVSADINATYGEDNYFIGATLANTFTCTVVDHAEETYYQLKDESVAGNKANQGEDCGAFAGSWPFVINGRPQGLPYIYDVSAPNYPTDDQLTITFKVKANNQ